MFVTIDLKRLIKIVLIVALLAAAAVFVKIFVSNGGLKPVISQNSRSTLVLDAGHGGIDGGAISDSGLKESDINLQIALKTEALVRFLGIDTVMTRETDTDNSDNKAYSEHDNLVQRAKLANSTENAVLISIHQNKFPSAVVSGAEVMYSDNDDSKALGLITQDNLVALLDSSNRRVARPAPKELLLTSSVECPTILVECGFMSNPQEVQKLASNDYQLKLAAILAGSYIQFLNNTASA
ncbi:n-acetylmuramoyl-L-alanine amidase CwlD [Firmicutes bacterium CAG:555]|nr:n-acetylmuramoyl-L-alanine amidase CwlD [Firmicutes bacterium CAG:555]